MQGDCLIGFTVYAEDSILLSEIKTFPVESDCLAPRLGRTLQNQMTANSTLSPEWGLSKKPRSRSGRRIFRGEESSLQMPSIECYCSEVLGLVIFEPKMLPFEFESFNLPEEATGQRFWGQCIAGRDPLSEMTANRPRRKNEVRSLSKYKLYLAGQVTTRYQNTKEQRRR